MSNKDFKVVKILDEYKIIINAGIENGIAKDDIFEILGGTEAVTDPDTGEKLGEIYIIKATVQVSNLYPRMVECVNTIYNQEVKVSDILGIMTKANDTVFTKEGPRRLNVDRDQISSIAKSGDPIRIGDKARLKR